MYLSPFSLFFITRLISSTYSFTIDEIQRVIVNISIRIDDTTDNIQCSGIYHPISKLLMISMNLINRLPTEMLDAMHNNSIYNYNVDIHQYNEAISKLSLYPCLIR